MKYRAFTLAEVLITLAIIGIVATMTIPTLIDKYREKVIETQKAKLHAVYTQAFKMLMAKDGRTDLLISDIAGCNNDKNCYAKELNNVFKVAAQVKNNSKESKTKYTFENSKNPEETWTHEVWANKNNLYVFRLNDGTINALEKTNDMKNANFSFIVDINGLQLPNKGAEDLCRYTVSSTGEVTESCPSMTYSTEIFAAEEGTAPVKGSTTCLSGTSSNCTRCSAGSYLSNKQCKACPAGTYSANGATQCTPCPAGKYSSATTKTCGICKSGTYTNSTGSMTCTKCAPGYYSSSAGSNKCTPCSIGTYNSGVGATACQKCPFNTTSNPGASKIQNCK